MTDEKRSDSMPEQEVSSTHDLAKRYSRVTILDRQSLFVTGSAGDFASTVLEEIVQEHIPAYTHNPPTLILLESDLDWEIEKPSPLGRELFDVLRKHQEPA